MMGRIVGLTTLVGLRKRFRREGKIVVFTNGTFDILHRGHVDYLKRARSYGDVLMVGLNSDASIRRIKGRGRPVNKGTDRAIVLAALSVVDYVSIFRENTPGHMIERLVPDVLVKGADWKMREIVGRGIVEKAGGRVVRVRLTKGRSTTGLIERIQRATA